MNQFKIETGGISYMLKTNQTKARLITNPALFFLCKGEYQVQECGQYHATKRLINHAMNIVNKLRYFNEA